jgi:hypothetical protein
MMQAVASADVYEVGEQVGLGVRFGTEEEPFEPTRVIVRLRDPQGRTAELTYGVHDALVRSSPGCYQVVVTASIPGRWHYRFVGLSGMARAEHEGFFDVFDLEHD